MEPSEDSIPDVKLHLKSELSDREGECKKPQKPPGVTLEGEEGVKQWERKDTTGRKQAGLADTETPQEET